MIKTTILASLVVSVTTPFLAHPISLVSVILAQTLILVIMGTLINQTPWFSFVILLIFLGGVMVLFIYMASLASNENFQADQTLGMFVGSIFLACLLLLPPNKETINLALGANWVTALDSVFTPQTMFLLTSTMMFLLLTLLVIVEIVKQIRAPLRSSF